MAALELRRKRTQQLFTWGDISETDYRQKVSKIKTDLAELRPPKYHEVFTAGDLLADIGQIWGEATLKEKRSLLPLVIQQAEIESRCLVSVTPTLPFCAIMTAQLERYVVRSRPVSGPRAVTPNDAILSPDDPRTAVRICAIEVFTPCLLRDVTDEPD